MSSALASGNPVFLVGDFNEPSHLDWTQEAANQGLNFGMKVDWPTSHSVTNAGLTDAFRQVRPDEVLDRGETWTPGYPAPNVDLNEVHDRIDFVYYKGTNTAPTSAPNSGIRCERRQHRYRHPALSVGPPRARRRVRHALLCRTGRPNGQLRSEFGGLGSVSQ